MTSLPAIPGALSHTVQIARQRGGLNASKTKNMLRTVDMSAGVQLEPVTSDDTERHSIALEILVSGYVDAYIEFFSITEHNPTWHNEVDVLRLLQLNLARAEEARRKGDALLTCNSYNQLAAYFESKGDRDTAFHFYNMCIEALNSAPGNIGKKAETYGQIGLLAEMRGKVAHMSSPMLMLDAGDLLSSLHAFEAMYTIAKANKLVGTNGQATACRHVVRINTLSADKVRVL